MTTAAGSQPEQSDWVGKDTCLTNNGLDVAAAASPEARWLGLVTDHRRLFDALQDGWLRPLPSDTGLVVGIETYAHERNTDGGRYRISVRIKLNMAKLPALDFFVFRDGRWIAGATGEFQPSDSWLYWPGVLPTFAISELSVSTEEERTRLTSMARQFSNVKLPEVPVRIDMGPADGSPPPAPPSEKAPGLLIPSHEDSIHGAMSMAVWAVPRIDPWLEILTTSLSSDQTGLAKLAEEVDAEWWRFPPWASSPNDTPPSSLQDRLWLAAIDILRDRSTEGHMPPRDTAEQIAATVSLNGCSSDADGASTWLWTTLRILRAESPIQFDQWRTCPVGMAIQLVLARPEPTAFKTWAEDRPDLPPAVWWSAAVLCGLRHGYRKLDIRFRGKTDQCELLSIHALRTCASKEVQAIRWPSLASGEPSWRREKGGFALFWGDRKFADKQIHARGKWFAANFGDLHVRNKAREVAKELEWPCLKKEYRLAPGRRLVSGLGNVKVLDRKIVIQGDVGIQWRSGDDIVEEPDIESFRKQVAVASGRLPEPPSLGTSVASIAGVPGLAYVPDFISEREEEMLVEEIDRHDWSEELQRRVQHYGWRYDYKARHVDSTMRLGDLPRWADDLAERLVSKGLVSNLPDQVIVNEYIKNQGISPHIDSESSFDDGIATISLLESWEMIFSKKRGKGKPERQAVRLDRRSVAIMKNEARYDWKHEIPKRKTEPGTVEPGRGKSGRVPRERRLSLTFRKVLDQNPGTRDDSPTGKPVALPPSGDPRTDSELRGE